MAVEGVVGDECLKISATDSGATTGEAVVSDPWEGFPIPMPEEEISSGCCYFYSENHYQGDVQAVCIGG